LSINGRSWKSMGTCSGASAARGVLDRVAKLASNRRAVPVASGLGSQLGPLMFHREAPAIQSDAG
jgi:hypothetical protein